MKKYAFILWGFIFILFCGCATSGQKFIDITYHGDQKKIQNGSVGIAPFKDNRTGMGQGYVGYRILLDNTRQTYLVNGLDLASSLTRTIALYFKKKGFSTVMIDPWELTPEDVIKAGARYSKIIEGTINQFECRARKKGPATQMVLDIDLTLYIGTADENSLKTIPVSLTLERTQLTFTPEKLEGFVNRSLGEIMQKAFKF